LSALGPRGLSVVTIAGIVGVCLAIVGWTQRGTGLVAPLISSPPTQSATAAAPPTATATPSPTATASPTDTASPTAAAGPQLRTESYASYAYQVWPGPLSADGKLALTGFSLTVTRQSGGITVKAIQDGTPMTSVSHFYANGAKVYVLDSNLGDDGGGNVDYDESDDGLVVTNAQGQVLP
jgi:hypothetical protein